jgi:hypothetical protein
MEASLWTPICKIGTNVFSQQPTFSIYLHESLTLGKPCGIKLKCYWKHLKGTTWELGELFYKKNMMRTCWKHIGNKEGTKKKKKTPPTLLRKEKKGPIMSTCWAFLLVAWTFYFQNSLWLFLARANGWGRNLG